MPPQQAYGLLDFVDDVLDFVTHFVWIDPVGADCRLQRRGT
jgi:hypothetical protein